MIPMESMSAVVDFTHLAHGVGGVTDDTSHKVTLPASVGIPYMQGKF
jgi:hypothetical protein